MRGQTTADPATNSFLSSGVRASAVSANAARNIKNRKTGDISELNVTSL